MDYAEHGSALQLLGEAAAKESQAVGHFRHFDESLCPKKRRLEIRIRGGVPRIQSAGIYF